MITPQGFSGFEIAGLNTEVLTVLYPPILSPFDFSHSPRAKQGDVGMVPHFIIIKKSKPVPNEELQSNESKFGLIKIASLALYIVRGRYWSLLTSQYYLMSTLVIMGHRTLKCKFEILQYTLLGRAGVWVELDNFSFTD